VAGVPITPKFRRQAAASEDAFDAAVSALAMAAAEELLALPDEPGYALEGRIWQPRVPVAFSDAARQPPCAPGCSRSAGSPTRPAEGWAGLGSSCIGRDDCLTPARHLVAAANHGRPAAIQCASRKWWTAVRTSAGKRGARLFRADAAERREVQVRGDAKELPP